MSSLVLKNDCPCIALLQPCPENQKDLALSCLQNVKHKSVSNTPWVFSNVDSKHLVKELESTISKQDIPRAFLVFLAAVFYRYTYQSDFELLYTEGFKQVQQTNKTAIDFARIQFQDHTQFEIKDLMASINQALSSVDSGVLFSDTSFKAAYVVFDLASPIETGLSHLIRAFEQHKGIIWPIIERHDNRYQLKWMCGHTVSQATIETLQTHLLNLVRGVGLHPELALSKHAMLSDTEIAQQLAFSKGKRVKHSKQALYKIVEQHALDRSDETAVLFRQERLSYQQLNVQANRLAHALLQQNIQPKSAIAVHIKPSEKILIALLAIHKIGAIYIPIDPTFPAARIGAILEEVEPLLILCDASEKDLPTSFSKRCADINSLINTANCDTNPEIPVSIKDISHIYFTSGTTGKPKGVLSTHQNLIHYISVAINRYRFNQDDRFIAAAKFTFSISMFELLTPLVAGGSVNILSRDQVLDLDKLCHLIAASTVFHFGPSLLKQLLPYIEENYSSFDAFTALRHVSSGGDMIPPEILEHLKRIFSNAEVYVIYGSSEISCMGCTYRVERGKTLIKTKVGRPHQNMTVRIFDHQGNMVPIGVAGQLHFAGSGLVKGYLNQPELTNEKFREIDKQRFYAIGDIGRLDENGDIELLGREDFQIQLRGIRIELAEIDGYLRATPEVKDAVAVAGLLGNNDEKSIIAYVVSKTGSALSSLEMKKHLAQFLPDYMVPAAFIQLDSLPLNHNMKVDRSALPSPDNQNILGHSTQPIELTRTLKKIIKTINQVCPFEVTSEDAGLNFYTLGMESISLMQIRIALNKQFEKNLPLSVFQQEQASIETIAHYVDKNATASDLADDAPIELIPKDQPIRASSAQQRLWFLDRLLGASGLYNIPLAIRFNGLLNTTALEQSIQAIVTRHESLRTGFIDKEGTPFQFIRNSIDFKCERIDLSSVDDNKKDIEAQSFLNIEANKAFDLKQAPLLRAVLLKLSDQTHILSLTLHHIISDGWSINIFKQELTHFYSAFHEGNTPELPDLADLPVQYADFSAWQSGWPAGEQLKQQLGYWEQQLNNVSTLNLPTDHPRPKQLTYQGAQIDFAISRPLTEGLKALAQDNGVSLFMTLLAAFQVLLHRYSAQDDIVVGSPIAGRNRAEVENLIGFFINTLVLRSDFSAQPSFRNLLKAVRKTCMDAYAHQDVPFETLVAHLQPERDLSRHPFYQVMLILQPAMGQEIQLPGLESEEMNMVNETTKFDLTLSLHEYPDGLRGNVEYSTDLYEEATIQRLLGHFQTLLEGIVSQPDSIVSTLPLLTLPEHQRLMLDWNDTASDFPVDQTMLDLFEQQVRTRPDNIAVVFEGQQLSYRQLNERANQLAHYLISLTGKDGTLLVSNNTMIAIAIDRSIDASIGLLAILKAGAAYVPIDPFYPPARIRHMLEDSRAPIMLTHSHLSSNLSLDSLTHEYTVLCLDQVALNKFPIDAPKKRPQPDDLAYMIYTSGSTGKPKGVMIEHRSLSNFLQDMRQRIGISDKDNLLAVTTLCFDIAALEFHLPLISGSTLHIANRATASDGKALQIALSEHHINYMQATPITWDLLKKNNWVPDQALNILCGGEALSTELAHYLSNNGHRVWNVYGPTETTIWSSADEIDSKGEGSPSIGQAISNTRIYILNQQNQLQPQNIPGELCIAGAGLARGYYNLPELTAEKFIDIEIMGKPERIYKTGDLAKWHPDGRLECLGRIDHQIKLRGYRVEMGDIESHISQLPGVDAAVVTLREDQPGNKRLVAYLSCEQDESVSEEQIRQHLKANLPHYMIPSAFVSMQRFPQTPNGKIDRKALPPPEPTKTETGESFVGASSVEEDKLTQIWQAVLNNARIGVHDDFFDLGGHSLLAVSLLSKIEKSFGKELSLASIFQAPTIAQLAELLLKDETGDNADAPVLLGTAPPETYNEKTQPPLFCIYGVFLYQTLAKNLQNDVAVYGVYIQEEVDLIKSQAVDDTLSQDVTEIARKYIKQIRTIQSTGPYNLAGASFGGIVAYEIAQQLKAAGESVNILALFDAMAPSGYTRSFPRRIANYARRIKAEGIYYIVERIQRKLGIKANSEHSNVDKNVDKDVRAMVRKTAIGTFSPTPYSGKLALIRVKDEDQWAGYKVDEAYGWRGLAKQGVDLIELPTSHLGLLKAPYVTTIADYIRGHL